MTARQQSHDRLCPLREQHVEIEQTVAIYDPEHDDRWVQAAAADATKREAMR